MSDFLNPEKVINQLNLRDDMLAAEFGCGAGDFTLALAKRLKEGLVYGIDIQEEPLSALQSQARLQGIRNIRTIRSDLEKERGSTLSDQSLDLVLVPNLLFQAEDKDAIIREAGRVLRQGGQLLAADWLKEARTGPEAGRISVPEIRKIAESLGFEFKKECESGSFHWGLIFEKKSAAE